MMLVGELAVVKKHPVNSSAAATNGARLPGKFYYREVGRIIAEICPTYMSVPKFRSFFFKPGDFWLFFSKPWSSLPSGSCL